MLRTGLLIFMALALNCLAGCGGCTDYSVKLPNGYLLARTNKDSIEIFEPQEKHNFHGVPVPPKIIELNVVGDIVLGRIEYFPDTDFPDTKEPGFFILDTKNDKVKTGLQKEEWLNSLKKLGIAQEPRLKKPSRSFSW